MSAKEYKHLKGLKKENLRDNMTDLGTIAHSLNIARRGGGVAKVAREALEDQLGRSIISSENAKTLNAPKAVKEIEEQ